MLPRISKRQSVFIVSHCFMLLFLKGTESHSKCFCQKRSFNLRPGKVGRLGFVQLSQLPVDLGANA